MGPRLLGRALAAFASLLCTASAQLPTCDASTAFDPNTLSSGCCNSWSTKRDIGEISLPSLLGRDTCSTTTCCTTQKTEVDLSPVGSDIQCGSKFDPTDGSGSTTQGIQYSLGPCAADATKTCLIITVTPVSSGGCLTLASGISIFIDDGSVAPTTSSGTWDFANANPTYCTQKTSSANCPYWYCEFQQSLWESKIQNEGTDGICGNTISVGVHFGIGANTCTQGNTGLNYGSNFFQYAKVSFNCKQICDTTSLCCCPCNSVTHCCPGDTFCGGNGNSPNPNCTPECCPGQTRCDNPKCTNNPTPNCCPLTENYCGTDGLTENQNCPQECCSGQTRCDNPTCTNNPTPNCCTQTENYCGNNGMTQNTQCTPTCCGGTCCADKLCCSSPSDYNYCPQPQCQLGTGWGWMLPAVDDSSHFVNTLKLCSSSRWGEWFDIASLPYTGELVVGRGGNDVTKGTVVGTVSLQAAGSTVSACFDVTQANVHITNVNVEVSCNPFDSTAFISSQKKSFNICAPGQWNYRFPPSGCLDWVSSQHGICITGIPKCSGHYYAIFHASVTDNADGSCSPISGCYTDTG